MEKSFDLSYDEIVSNFNDYINRMRLISDPDFDRLSPEKKIETIFELNEDQLSERDCDCFRQMASLDFKKQDLVEAIQELSFNADSQEELVIWSPGQFSEEYRDQVQTILGQKIKSPIHVIFKSDPDLILGCKIIFRRKNYDLSFQGQAPSLINKAIKMKTQDAKLRSK